MVKPKSRWIFLSGDPRLAAGFTVWTGFPRSRARRFETESCKLSSPAPRRRSLLTLINTILAGNTTGGFSDQKLSNIGTLPVVVTTAADSGLGSERAALGIAPGGAMITFALYLAAQTTTLTSGEILLNTTRAIDASGSAGGAKVSGNNTGRIFRMGVSGDVTLMGLKLINGQPFSKAT